MIMSRRELFLVWQFLHPMTACLLFCLPGLRVTGPTGFDSLCLAMCFCGDHERLAFVSTMFSRNGVAKTFLGGVFPSMAAFLASVLCSPLFSPYSLQNRSAIACRIAGVDEGRRNGKPIATSYSPSPDHVGGRPLYSSCES